MKILKDLAVSGQISVGQLLQSSIDTDKFLVAENGVVKFRTGSEILSDIGGISGNQNITLSGDASGSGATAITVTLANSGVAAGTYRSVTVDAKGRVTSGTNPTTISGYGITDFYAQVISGFIVGANTSVTTTDSLEVAIEKLQGQINARLSSNQTITLSGDVTGSGSTAIAVTLANSGVAAGTYNNVTVNAKGLVTSGSNVSYLTSYTETDTLATVTGRGASTSTAVSLNGGATIAGVTVGGDIAFSGTGRRVVVAQQNRLVFSYQTLSTVDSGSDRGGWMWNAYYDWSVPGYKFLNTNSQGAQMLWISNGDLRLYRKAGPATADASFTWDNNWTIWHAGNLTNLNQLTNGPGYITGYTETDTLATVTGRGNTTTNRIGVTTSSPINFAGAGNAGTWIGGIQDATSGWSISNNGLGLKADDTTYAGIVLASGNGLLYFGRTQAGGTGTMASWLEVNSSGVANFKLARPQHNGSNLALVSEIPTNLNQLTNGPGYITSSGTAANVSSLQLLGTGVSYNTDRTTKISNGIAIYGAYSGGANSPYTYDLAAQFIRDSRGFEFSASWHSPSATLSFRTLRDCCDNWSAWVTMLTSANYNSYSPTLTGGGATGSWGINITGTAASETLASVAGRGSTTSTPITINGGGSQPITLTTANGSPWHLALVRNDLGLTSRVFAHNSPYNGWYFEHNIIIAGNTNWHSGNDGSGSGLDADSLDGQDGSYYAQASLSNNKTYTSTGNIAGSYLGGHYSSGGNEKPNSNTFGAGKLKIAMLSNGNLGYGGAWNDVLWISSYNGGDVKSSHALAFDKYSTDIWVSDQNFDSASWGAGYKLLHSGNYNDYAPTKIGGGASGTWGISITGSAGSLSNMNISQFTNNSGYITSTNTDFTYNASLTISTSWQDTGVSNSNLTSSGVYVVTVLANDAAVAGYQYSVTHVGLMYWYAASTNGVNFAEIPLHHMGHADNDRYFYLRTRTTSGGGGSFLQIRGNYTTNGNSTYTFTFKRLL